MLFRIGLRGLDLCQGVFRLTERGKEKYVRRLYKGFVMEFVRNWLQVGLRKQLGGWKKQLEVVEKTFGG